MQVVTQSQIICRLPEYFEDPDEFIPERWLRDENKENSLPNPYLSIPFGIGQRACVARWFAQQNMQILLIRVSFAKF